jgi:hypothetical protein
MTSLSLSPGPRRRLRTRLKSDEALAVGVRLALEGDRQLVDRVQHDHRYLAFGLELIVAVGRPKFERLFLQSRMRSSPVAVLARAFSFLVPTCTSTSGLARILRYHPGCWGAPPFDAITK